MEGKVLLSQYLICVMLLLGQINGCRSCILKENEALFELKKYLLSMREEGYSDYSVLPTWINDTKSDCCQWNGVKCNRTSGRVIEIGFGFGFGSMYLKENSLLNLSLLHPFEEVRSLNLSLSRFNGLFDDVEGYKSLRRFSYLEILDLSYNRFNNSIFPFLNAATSLTTLFLGSNNLDGPFHVKELKDLKNLELLELSGNRFNGSIPIRGYKSLRRLRNLEVLDLSSNNFNSSIFPFLNAATSLTTLILSWNKMDGPLHVKELKDLKNLELLDLSWNNFNGSIPIQEFTALRKLKALDLSNNGFSGPIKLQEFIALRKLKALALSGIYFPTSIELQGVCKLKNIEELDLSKNRLVGQLPSCITSLTGLRVLDLSSNNLTGRLPSALGNLESLEYLSLIDNNFEGVFSLGSLTNLSKLKVLILGSTSNSLNLESESSWKPKFQLSVISENSWKPKFQLSVISLETCNLGKVPHFLLYQKDLRHVDLSNNQICGKFPYWLLENNTRLEVLFLQNNYFRSFQLPESDRNLLWLDVSVNKFDQLFPENIGWILPHLRYMNLANNDFQGNLPSSLGNMKSIEYLDISHNNFQGKLPRNFLKGCYSLNTLKMSHNNLSGEVFLESANFTHLFVLLMDNNQFTGKIGQGLRSLESLEILDISNNNLSGVIPSWIGELTFLSALLLSNNSLEGEIPVSLFNMSSLSVLDLSANILSGAIPIMSEYVEILDLRNNRLSGNIPEFVNPQSINILLLRGNNLTGRIPQQLCGLSNIQLLDLSNNRLIGSIPSCLSNTSFGFRKKDAVGFNYDSDVSSTAVLFSTYFKSLIVEYYFSSEYEASTQTKIQFATKHRYDAYWGGNLKLLFGVDLSENELSGEIPVELGSLMEIQSFNLSHNNLSGVIPKSFSGLKNVESLDLSFNRLQGPIPSQLTDLTSLEVFNVSYNNLSGVIPQGRQFDTFLCTQSYLGNPLLRGKPINLNCESNTFQVTDNGVEEADESTIDMVSFYWSFAAAYVTILVGIFASLSFDSPWSIFWFYIVDVFIYKAKNLLW